MSSFKSRELKKFVRAREKRKQRTRPGPWSGVPSCTIIWCADGIPDADYAGRLAISILNLTGKPVTVEEIVVGKGSLTEFALWVGRTAAHSLDDAKAFLVRSNEGVGVIHSHSLGDGVVSGTVSFDVLREQSISHLGAYFRDRSMVELLFALFRYVCSSPGRPRRLCQHLISRSARKVRIRTSTTDLTYRKGTGDDVPPDVDSAASVAVRHAWVEAGETIYMYFRVPESYLGRLRAARNASARPISVSFTLLELCLRAFYENEVLTGDVRLKVMVNLRRYLSELAFPSGGNLVGAVGTVVSGNENFGTIGADLSGQIESGGPLLINLMSRIKTSGQLLVRARRAAPHDRTAAVASRLVTWSDRGKMSGWDTADANMPNNLHVYTGIVPAQPGKLAVSLNSTNGLAISVMFRRVDFDVAAVERSFLRVFSIDPDLDEFTN